MCSYKICENSLISLFSSSVKSVKEEIQLFDDCVVEHLNNCNDSFKGTL